MGQGLWYGVEITMNQFCRNQGAGFLPITFSSPSSMVLLLVLILTLLSSAVQGETFFVATTGNDSWSGEMPVPSGQNGPFATLTRARAEARKLIHSGLTEAVNVMVRGGTYYLDETLVLDSRDSGTRGHRITWSAYEDEKPVISGGKPITNWVTYQGDIQWATVTPGWRFIQLFLNGERQIRSRAPNLNPANPLYGGWAFMEGRGDHHGEGKSDFKYPANLFQGQLAKPDLADVFLNAGFGSDMTPIVAIDDVKRIIHTNYSAIESYTSNTRFRVENALEELDQPGEWFLDWKIGKVYFWPRGNLSGAEVAAPSLWSLITLSGAEHITLSGFTFTNTRARGGISRAAVILQSTSHCRVMRNHFSAVGGHAINLVGNGSANPCELNLVQHNEISLAGDEAIHLRDTAQFNHILDNHVHDCGLINHYSAGITFGTHSPATETRHSNGNLVAHNEVHDLPRDGITVGANPYGRNVVRYNVVQRTGREAKDAGALRSWLFGSSEAFNAALPDIPEMLGHIFEYNFVTDVLGAHAANGQITVPYDGLGVYLDDLTANTVVRGNIIARAALSGFHTNYGRNNLLENNIFVDCQDQVTFSKPPHIDGAILDEYMVGNRVLRNILYTTNRESPSSRFPYVWNFMSCPSECSHAVAESDYNLFYRSDGSYSGLFSWQALGQDGHSTTGDPLFTGKPGTTATWSAAADFKSLPGDNPGPLWSYHDAGEPPGNPSRFGDLLVHDETVWDWGEPGWIWEGQDPAESGSPPAVIKGPKWEVRDFELVGHGPFFVRWTASLEGMIRISGYVYQLTSPSNNMRWILEHNGVELGHGDMPFEPGRNTTKTVRAGYSHQECSVDFGDGATDLNALTRPVADGDTIDLIVWPNPNAPVREWNTTVGLRFEIDQVADPGPDLPEQFGYRPEPESAARQLGITAIDVARMGRRADTGPYQGFVSLTIQVESPGPVETVLPAPGSYQIARGEVVLLSAMDAIHGPRVDSFSRWRGDVADSTSSTTSILLDEDKTVTCVFIDEQKLQSEFLRGDVDGNGGVDLSDPINNLKFQILGTFEPGCMDALDFNDTGVIDISDSIDSLTFQFLGGVPPPDPGKDSCGADPTDDDLECESFPPCE